MIYDRDLDGQDDIDGVDWVPAYVPAPADVPAEMGLFRQALGVATTLVFIAIAAVVILCLLAFLGAAFP